MGYQKLGYKMSLVPSEDKSTYKVQLKSPKGATYYKYFDKNSGYLTKFISYSGNMSYLTDYIDKNGFAVNRKVKSFNEKGLQEELSLIEFKINPEYDPSIFEF